MSDPPGILQPVDTPVYLPDEILILIARVIDAEDLSTLRAVSKLFHRETETRFAGTYFTNIYYPATPQGLARLIDITKHTLFSQKVRSVIGFSNAQSPQRGWSPIIRAYNEIAVTMHVRNFGILLVDNLSFRDQNEATMDVAACLNFYRDPDKLIVDVQESATLSPDNSIDEKLWLMKARYYEERDIVIRFVRKNERSIPSASVAFERTQLGRTLTCKGTHKYQSFAQQLADEDELTEIILIGCEFVSTDGHVGLQDIVKKQINTLRCITIKDARTTKTCSHVALKAAIMECDNLEFCLMRNLRSSDGGLEFRGTFEASGSDEIRAGLMDLDWARAVPML